MAKFSVGDIVERVNGVAKYEILGVDTASREYQVKVLRSINQRRAGVIDRKSMNMIDREYMKASAAPGTYSYKVESIPPHEVTHLCTITRKSKCDCGGHKLGYTDDQLFGHGTWCKLVELSKEKAS